MHAEDIYTNLELHILHAAGTIDAQRHVPAVAGGRPVPWLPLNGWTFDGCKLCTSTAEHACEIRDGDTLGQCPSCGHETLIGEKP